MPFNLVTLQSQRNAGFQRGSLRLQHNTYKPMRLLTGVSCLESPSKVSATSLSFSAPLSNAWNFYRKKIKALLAMKQQKSV